LKAKADQLVEQINQYPEDTFAAALDGEAFVRAQKFQAGVQAYQHHPYQRSLSEPPAIWSEGNSRLLDYGGPKGAPVVLAVPSLINKAYILDLNEKRSLMRTLAQKGVRAFLLDWGEPGPGEQNFNLEDYVMGRLNDAVDEIIQQTGQSVTLLGYCMGGVLCTALTALEPEKIDRLALLATPWDFQAGQSNHTQVIQAAKTQLDMVMGLGGHLPVDVLQSLFAAIDPYRILKKFADFADMPQDGAQAEKFVAMEDWLNDGVPLVAPLARDCLYGWYLDNFPARGLWEMDGHIIDPADITQPVYAVVPQNDRIVPPESAKALVERLPNVQCKMQNAGHIGMVTGRNAARSLYAPLAKWLLKQEK